MVDYSSNTETTENQSLHAEVLNYEGRLNQNNAYSFAGDAGQNTNPYENARETTVYQTKGEYPMSSWLPFVRCELDMKYTLFSIFKKYKNLNRIQESWSDWQKKQIAANKRYYGNQEKDINKLDRAYFPDFLNHHKGKTPYYFLKSDFEKYGAYYVGLFFPGIDLTIEGLEEANDVRITRKGQRMSVIGLKGNKIYLPFTEVTSHEEYYANKKSIADLESETVFYKKNEQALRSRNRGFLVLTKSLARMEVNLIAFQRALADYYAENMMIYFSMTYPNHQLSKFDFIENVQFFNSIMKQTMVTAIDGTAIFGGIKTKGAKNFKKAMSALAKLRKAGKIKTLLSASGGPLSFLFMMACDYALGKLVEELYPLDDPDADMQLNAELSGVSLKIRNQIINAYKHSFNTEILDAFKTELLDLSGGRSGEKISQRASKNVASEVDKFSDILNDQTRFFENGGDFDMATRLLNEWLKQNKNNSQVNQVYSDVQKGTHRMARINDITNRARRSYQYLEALNDSAVFKRIGNRKANWFLNELNIPFEYMNAENISVFARKMNYYNLGLSVWFNQVEQLPFLPDDEFNTRASQIEKRLENVEKFMVRHPADDKGKDNRTIELIIDYLDSIGITGVTAGQIITAFGLGDKDLENDRLVREHVVSHSAMPITIRFTKADFLLFKNVLAIQNQIRREEIQGIDKALGFEPKGDVQITLKINKLKLSPFINLETNRPVVDGEIRILISNAPIEPQAPRTVEEPKELKEQRELISKKNLSTNQLPYNSRLPVWNTNVDGTNYWHWSFFVKFAPDRRINRYWNELKRFRRSGRLVVNDKKYSKKRYNHASATVFIPPATLNDGPEINNSGYYFIGAELFDLHDLVADNEVVLDGKRLDFNLERILAFNKVHVDNGTDEPLSIVEIQNKLKHSRKKLYIPFFLSDLLKKNSSLSGKIDRMTKERDKEKTAYDKQKGMRERLSRLNEIGSEYIRESEEYYATRLAKSKMNTLDIFKITRSKPLSKEGLIKVSLNWAESFLNAATATGIDDTKTYDMIKNDVAKVIREMIHFEQNVILEPTFTRKNHLSIIYKNGAFPLSLAPLAYKVTSDFSLNMMISSVYGSLFGSEGKHETINKSKTAFSRLLHQSIRRTGNHVRKDLNKSRRKFQSKLNSVDKHSEPEEVERLIANIQKELANIRNDVKGGYIGDREYTANFLEVWAMENSKNYFGGSSSISKESWNDAMKIIYEQNMTDIGYDLMRRDDLPFGWKELIMNYVNKGDPDGLVKAMQTLAFFDMQNSPGTDFSKFDPLGWMSGASEFGKLVMASGILKEAMGNSNDIAFPLQKVNASGVKSNYEMVSRPLYYINQLQFIGSKFGFNHVDTGNFIHEDLLKGGLTGSQFLRVREEQEVLSKIYGNSQNEVTSNDNLLKKLEQLYVQSLVRPKWPKEPDQTNFHTIVYKFRPEEQNDAKKVEIPLHVLEKASAPNVFNMSGSSISDYKNLDLLVLKDAVQSRLKDMSCFGVKPSSLKQDDFWKEIESKGEVKAKLNMMPLKMEMDYKRGVTKIKSAACYLMITFKNKKSDKKPGKGFVMVWEEYF